MLFVYERSRNTWGGGRAVESLRRNYFHFVYELDRIIMCGVLN